MKKKCNVVMLSTNKKTKLFIRVDKPNLLLYNVSVGQSKTSMTHQGYYLYITSDDEIKENDYYVTDAGIFKCSGNETERELSKFKKVIATTDPIIINQKPSGEMYPDWFYDCAQIPESFIQEYVKNPVDEVMVEYWDNKPEWNTTNVEHIFTPVEEKMYSREEVITLIDDLLMTYPEMLGTHIWSIKGKWIKENL